MSGMAGLVACILPPHLYYILVYTLCVGAKKSILYLVACMVLNRDLQDGKGLAGFIIAPTQNWKTKTPKLTHCPYYP
ncbi:MAG: hypothetical protein U5K71_09935 [Gracilimonas sp.]|nr:hypothetical protein [Gracilimonas sp.]